MVLSRHRRGRPPDYSEQRITQEDHIAGTFELKKAANGKYHFNPLATNGEVLAQSQMYASKATALKGIESVRKNAADAKLSDQTGSD